MAQPAASRLARACVLAAALLLGASSAHGAPPPVYQLSRVVSLPGDGGWDYLAFEQGGHRLFIAHGTRVQVVDTETLSVVGEIANTPGVHGIALAPDLGRGYISAGAAGVIVVFDLKTLARLKEIKTTGDNPDAIVYDPATHRVFSFNGRGHNVTAVDTGTDTVIGSIALDAKPEFAASDGRGHIYVNLEDKDSIAVLDPRALSVTAVWPVTGCEEPSGLAFDGGARRLFAVCDNHVMAVVDADSGRVLGLSPIAEGPDAAAYDPLLQLAFASCGAGVLNVVALNRAGTPVAAQSLPTQRGARTMALDQKSHRIFLITADFGPPPPPTPASPHPRPVSVPGSFRLLVIAPHPRA
jgi:DNA-binding beta-propeller fold protein YncE